MKKFRIFVINPGSTSTKISVFQDENEVFSRKIEYSAQYIKSFRKIVDQFDMRLASIQSILNEEKIDLLGFDAISARGGTIKPVSGGVYLVNDRVVEDLAMGVYGEHASSLGGLLAHRLGMDYGLPAYLVDPDVMDELLPCAKLTGLPEIMRKSRFHALNQKAVARYYAKEIGKRYNELTLIVIHLGGGISVGLHQNGLVTDVNDSLDGDGPFSPERAGSMPTWAVIELCYSGEYTKEEVSKRLNGQGGIVAHLRTNDMKEVNARRKNGDKYAQLVYEAMAYRIAKDTGALAAAAGGKVDAIIFTGGIAHDDELVGLIMNRLTFIAKHRVYPGEFEMQSLASQAINALKGEEEVKLYS